MAVSLRKIVAERADYCCEYCFSQERFSPDPFSLEHILPRSKGGEDTKSNLAFACQGCNNRKYTRTSAVDPASGVIVPIYHPRNHRWVDHFAWGNEYIHSVWQKTPSSHTTIWLSVDSMIKNKGIML